MSTIISYLSLLTLRWSYCILLAMKSFYIILVLFTCCYHNPPKYQAGDIVLLKPDNLKVVITHGHGFNGSIPINEYWAKDSYGRFINIWETNIACKVKLE